MKKKTVAVLSTAVVTVGLIGGVAFAANTTNNVSRQNDQQTLQRGQGVSASAESVKISTKAQQAPDKDSKVDNSICGDNLSKDNYKDMIKIMRDNGFKDAARYMQTGDYDKMNEFMSNLSEEDYQKMIDIMKDNGYGSMAQVMESIGRDGMIQMHNSVGGMHNGGSGMMGGF